MPAGLGKLTASLKSFADFLRIDGDLINAAAKRSAGAADRLPRKDLRRWIGALPEAERTDVLVHLAAGEESQIRSELLRRFRKVRARADESAVKPRSVAELLAAAEGRAEERRRQEAERAAQETARREREPASGPGAQPAVHSMGGTRHADRR